MVVIALASHDLHRDVTANPVLPIENTPMSNHESRFSFESAPMPLTPPTSAIPLDGSEDITMRSAEDVLDEEIQVGSSSRTAPHYNGLSQRSLPSQPRPIPPPPNPRRHRSGVLMSRVRAHSSGYGSNPTTVTASKSWGELNTMGLGMGSMTASRGKEHETDGDHEAEEEKGKRFVSDGWRRGNDDEEDGMWDNSARFYHHMHSRPASRSTSRSTSPTRDPPSPVKNVVASPQESPIYVRRNLAAPIAGPGPPPALGLSTSLSPNHHFLHTHLPPAFPNSASSASSPEGNLLDPTAGAHHMVLTPTTQEWRELKRIGKLSGEDIDSVSGSSSGSYDLDDRRSSFGSDEGVSTSSSILLRAELDRPKLRHNALSADYLEAEPSHSPDPGDMTPERPLFVPVIIAPSPIMGSEPRIPESLSRLNTNAEVAEADLDRSNHDQFGFSWNDLDHTRRPQVDSPVHFNSIGRRESLKALKKDVNDEAPRQKTKRELERERLFRMVDEEYGAEEVEGTKHGSYGVREIGSGAGLGARPSSADAVLQGRSPVAIDTTPKSTTLPVPPKPANLSPTQPMRPLKPSPLQASPVTALDGLPSPADTPDSEFESTFPTHYAPSVASQTSRFDSIRQYSRALSSHHHIATRSAPLAPGSELTSAPSSPPRSPRSPRRRDTNRVSLVAGRVVQPFAYPPTTALPPGVNPNGSILTQKPSLQSFSPFKSPSTPVKSPSTVSPGHPLLPPHFPRFDSTISFAPSTGAPSECGTPTSEAAGGVGGRGIDDYVILKEAGKGAYGLVMRARVKGPKGEPVGDEVIIKYIIKARILADCWKKHKVLGPIPVEIHVMDQLRHLIYHSPSSPHPWDPTRTRVDAKPRSPDSLKGSPVVAPESPQASGLETPESVRSDGSGVAYNPSAQKILAAELKESGQRGHPNICKLLDFFEDREFYYLVMPRFGTGVDLFDRVESQPLGLDPFEVRSLVGQLADAVRFLHANGIVHRDIKDENVILDGQGRCQLIDFGSAAHWRPGKRWDTFSGTLHYASPEILRGDMYGGKEQDVWALGVVGYVLLVGETPFSDLPDEVIEGMIDGSRAEQALEARCGGEHLSEGGEEDGGGRLGDAADLIRRCLEMEVGDRPPAEAILSHRYLRGSDGWVGFKGWLKG